MVIIIPATENTDRNTDKIATINIICKSIGLSPILAPTRKLAALRPIVDARRVAQCTPNPAPLRLAISLYGM